MGFHEFVVAIVHARRALLIVSVLTLCGCATVGPQSITAGRGVYTEVINRTEDEQILNVLVRLRYDETFGMISVASVTANLRFRARAEAQFGIGESENFAGNLVPLAAGVAYEENPTISYVPLSGEDFTRRMLSPVSMREWVLLAGNAKHPGHVITVAARSVNGLRNPPSAKFARFVDLYDRLPRAAVLDIVQGPKTEGKTNYFWDIHDYADTHGDSVRELLDLLGIEAKLDGSAIVLPLREALGRSVSAIHMQTRSVFDVLRVFAAGIEIPSTHLEAEIVEPLTSEIPDERRFVTIRSTEKRPDDATVRIRFRDQWFYIDATDTRSKRAFLFLRTLIGMRLSETGAVQQAPVLTVPVN